MYKLYGEKHDLLQYSANLIMEWNTICTHSTLLILRSQNRPVLVRVLTHKGPQYWAKPITTKCIRHSSQLYYTPKFADLFLSLLLTNEARITKCVNSLHLIFSSINRTSTLLPSNRLFWNNFTHDIINHEIISAKIKSLKYKAALSGELEIITHDETFKTMFCLVGQSKMSQKSGELHSLHTIRGFTGCTFGLSAQRSTSALCFTNAVNASLDKTLATHVKFVYSDTPMRIYKAARLIFPSLIAVGEDPIHLAIRLEYCFAGNVTELSMRVRQLHYKFHIPSSSIERF